MKRYRYILAKCESDDPICKFRLVSSTYISTVAREPGRVYIRVWIPDDMKLQRSVDGKYSTTDDARTIGELGYDLIMTQWTGKRKVIGSCFTVKLKELSDEQLRLWTKSMFGNDERVLKEVVG